MQGFDPSAQGVLAVSARALKERLTRFFPAPQFALELMPAAMTPTVWKQLTQRLPFVGIAFQGFAIPGSSGTSPRIEQQWQLQQRRRAAASFLASQPRPRHSKKNKKIK